MNTTPEVDIVQGRTPDLPPARLNIAIDVLRAFTTTHVALHRCDDILLVETVEEAFRAAESHPDYLLAGERDARPVDGFDLGNSPTVHSRRRTGTSTSGMVLTTTNGVRAALHALEADAVAVTGWSNVEATLQFARSVLDGSDARVNLVASHPTSDEDLACAEYLASQLGAHPGPSATEVRRRIRRAQSAQKFYSTEFRLRDLDLASRRRETPWAMVVDLESGMPRVRRRPVSLP